MDATELFESVKRRARTIGEEFTEPDEDWLPFIAHTFSQRNNQLHILAIDPNFMDDSEAKKDLIEFLTEFILSKDIDSLCLILSTWVVHVSPIPGIDPESQLEGKAPSKHPDRIEELHCIAFDNSQVLSAAAQIERHANAPPDLTDWKPSEVTGRFIEPFRDALKIAARKRAS